MSKIDINTFNVRNILRAVSLTTRLPIDLGSLYSKESKTDATWAYPLVGLILSIPINVLGYVLLKLSVDSGIISALVIICLIFLTGAMHEDGLADTSDGFWGGWNKDTRLEIMKDSRIGTYGVIALIFSILLRWYCFKIIIDQNLLFVAATVSCVLSRSLMTFYMWATPNAKDNGLSFNAGRPEDISVIVACLMGVIITILLVGLSSVLLLLLSFSIVWLLRILSLEKINGRTGDTIGAVQQISDIIILCSIYLLINTQ